MKKRALKKRNHILSLIFFIVIFLIVIALLFFFFMIIRNKTILGHSIAIENKNLTGFMNSILFNISQIFKTQKEQITSSRPVFESAGHDSLKKINTEFNKDSEFDLKLKQQIYGLSINGEVNLLSDSSLIRVILIDNNNQEYLVYESYLLIEDKSINLKNVCEETCALEGIVPKSLKVQIEDASITITKIMYSTSIDSLKPNVKQKGVEQYNKELKKLQDDYKISKINSKGKKWLAGETSVSILSYADKKELFNRTENLPNLQGFEYYKGGIFELAGNSNNIASTVTNAELVSNISTMPAAWDWRNIMSQNWNTPVKNQGHAGMCNEFAAVASMESQINLYYGQHLDIDLSEQELADCIPFTSYNPPSYYYPDNTTKISDEICDPYAERYYTGSCNYTNVCSDWQSRAWNPSYTHIYYSNSLYKPYWTNKSTLINTSDDLKKIIITKGPLISYLNSFSHAVELEGYGGNSDWKILNACMLNDKICASTGCISRTGCINGSIQQFCVNDGTIQYINTLKCINNTWHDSRINCSINQICYQASIDNPLCVQKDSVIIPLGYNDCGDWADFGGIKKYYGYYKQYSPGNGDSYWIFKNSWGTGWGDNGYGTIIDSLSDFNKIGAVTGPFTPPTNNSYLPVGFSNSQSSWFYKQTCNNESTSPNYTIKMGFTNGQQSISRLSCSTGQVCLQTDVSFISCSRLTPDTIPPNVSITLPTNGSILSNIKTISIFAVDNVKVTKVEFYVDNILKSTITTPNNYNIYNYNWSTTTVANGQHTLTAKAYDAAGNIETSLTIIVIVNNVIVDTSPPTAPTNLVSTGKTANSISLSWTASTDDVGVLGYRIYRNNVQVGTSSGTSYTNTGLLSSTTYLYYITAYDASGKVSNASNTISVTTNQNIICSSNSNCGTNKYVGSAFCQNGNVYQNYITFTCNNPGTSSSYCSNSTSAILIQTCVYGCANGVCNPDMVPPVVYINSPVNNSVVKGVVKVSASASDLSGIRTISIAIDGSTLNTCTISTTCSFNWNTNKATKGNHIIKAGAYDNSGNYASNSITVRV